MVHFGDVLQGGGHGEHSLSVDRRGRVVTVETDPVRPVQLDGEAAGETPFTAEILPGALRILVPSTS